MRAFNKSNKNKKHGKYDYVKSNLIAHHWWCYELENRYDFFICNYKEGSNYGRPLNVYGTFNIGPNQYFKSYRELYRVLNESSNWKYFGTSGDGYQVFIKMDDVKEIRFNRFVVLKRGGIFDTEYENWITKKSWKSATKEYSSTCNRQTGKYGLSYFLGCLYNDWSSDEEDQDYNDSYDYESNDYSFDDYEDEE